jgi:N6-L-threonylcarbamoyladenine synthase
LDYFAKERLILAIESSCDDTSAAVLLGNTVLSNVVSSQAIHAQYGGVVPELASREHQKSIVPVVELALRNAGVDKKDLEAVAYTRGPGLLGSLLVANSFAKSLSVALGIPLLEVHHMKAHILAHCIAMDGQSNPEFPFLCLTVSGGHTQLVLVESAESMKILGQTLDDAAGEAFDKTAKLLGLPYPGGPLIDKYAKDGNPKRFQFSKPKVEGLGFSFSGLKTGVLYFLQKEMQQNPSFVDENLNDICASIQSTIVEILVDKTREAMAMTKVKQIALAGGVSANSSLRAAFIELGEQTGASVFIPPFSYCTDNAAMIGIAGQFLFEEGVFGEFSSAPLARWEFGTK